jgi:hypothetical protein
MAQLPKYLPPLLSLLLLWSISGMTAAPTGVLQGRLRIIALKEASGAQLADADFSKAAANDYGNYPLVILSADRKTEIAQITASTDGSYRLALPPGDYVLDVKDKGRAKAEPQPFAIHSGQTVTVNMLISK